MDRRLLVIFASVAVAVGAAGYLFAQSRTNTSDVVATPVTLIAPGSLPDDAAAPSDSAADADPPASTIRSTLPPTPVSEVFQYAADGGCTPGVNNLPDGVYHGTVVAIADDRSLTFDLKCLFVADDVPDDFAELFALRFPGQEWSGASYELVDVAARERRVRFAWNSDLTFDGSLYVGDQAYVGFIGRDEEPFDATITVQDGAAVTVVEFSPEAVLR